MRALTQSGKVAPPNIESRLSSLDRAVSVFFGISEDPGGQKSRERGRANSWHTLGGVTPH
eukprot:8053079-Pyramimonas_sp.AAC.1